MPNDPKLSTKYEDVDKSFDDMTNYVNWSKKIKAAMILGNYWIDPSIKPEAYTIKQKETSKDAVQFMVMNLDASSNVHVTPNNEHCFYTVGHTLENFHKTSFLESL